MRLEGIVKRHGTTTVLHGVDLAIEPGEFFVLLGPSGSGKTTTLRILAGLEAVSEGRVLMDGVDVTLQEPGERDVAMVFQSYALYPHMTVAQNIGFPLRMVGIGTARDPARRGRRRRARSASVTSSPARRDSSPAGSSSAWRWPAPSCASRGCSCSTSRCRTSTPSCAWKPASSSTRCNARSAPPRCTSRTTRKRP